MATKPKGNPASGYLNPNAPGNQPVVPKKQVVPKPVTPKPITPKPVTPKPTTPKVSESVAAVGPLGGLKEGVVAGIKFEPEMPLPEYLNKIWLFDRVIQTANGPVDVDINGFARDGSTPKAISDDGGNASTSSKYAGLVALLSSYGIDKIANMVDKVIGDFPEASGDEVLNLLRYDSRYNAPYLARFTGNAIRLKNKVPLLSEATYLSQEKGYSKIFKSYGLKSMDNTDWYSKLIGADVSIDEAATRVSLAYDRVLKADPSTRDSFRKFFPMLSNQDLVAAMLDPEEQLPALERKVQSAEIGGAALRQGLTSELKDTTMKSAAYSNVQAGTIGAETIETAGATPASVNVKYQEIAGELPTMEKLSSIYGSTLDQYGQREAEQAKILGLASAKRKQEALIARERAEFGGTAGTIRGSQGTATKGQF